MIWTQIYLKALNPDLQCIRTVPKMQDSYRLKMALIIFNIWTLTEVDRVGITNPNCFGRGFCIIFVFAVPVQCANAIFVCAVGG